MSTLRLALGAGCSVLFAWVCFRRKGSCDVRAAKEYFGCFKAGTHKFRLNRKDNYGLADILLAFRYYMGYTLHRIQGKDDDYGLY